MLLPSCALESPPLIRRASQEVHERTAGLCVIVLVSLLFALPAMGQSQEKIDDSDVVKVTTDLLLFPIRVRDKNKQAVTGLTEKDLLLKDQNRITSGVYFKAGTDRVALVFALDQSGSLRDIISQQRNAALTLFERFNEKSSVAVIRFAEQASVAVPFGGDVTKARAAFTFSSNTNSHTAIFDAAQKTINEFEQLTKVRTERRIVILISDGLDTASKITAKSVIDSAIDKHVSFYVIHLPLFEPRDGQLAIRTPAKGFRDLAEKTGGKYFLVGDARHALFPKQMDLSPIFNAIEEDLKSQYLLGFYIAESAKDGRRHLFSVSLRPPEIQYSVGQLGYSTTHKFFVNSNPGATNVSR